MFIAHFHYIKLFVGGGSESQVLMFIRVEVLKNLNCFFVKLSNSKVMHKHFNSPAPAVTLKTSLNEIGKEGESVQLFCSAVGGFPNVTKYNLSISNDTFVQVCCKIFI